MDTYVALAVMTAAVAYTQWHLNRRNRKHSPTRG